METMVGLFTNILPVRIIVPDASVSIKWLSYVQNRLHCSKEFEYVSLSQIASWCTIPYEVLKKAVYERTVVYVDYPTDETIQIDGVGDYSSQGGLLVPIRMITGPELDFCIKYDRLRYSEMEIMSLLYKIRELLLGLCSLNK
jgi:phthiocerol/phenolphthiocerol synthesis type-I polyketide synthase E